MDFDRQAPDKFMEATARFLKTLYGLLLATIPMYWFVQEQMAAETEPDEIGPLKIVLMATAGGVAAAVLYLRFSRLGPLLRTPMTDPVKETAPVRFYYILCYTLSESVALYGFMLRVLGSSREDAIPFYVAAVGLFVVCYPRLPPKIASGPLG